MTHLAKSPEILGINTHFTLPTFSQSRLSPRGVNPLPTPTDTPPHTHHHHRGGQMKSERNYVYYRSCDQAHAGAAHHRKSGVCTAAHSMRRGIEVWGEIKTGGWESFFPPALWQKSALWHVCNFLEKLREIAVIWIPDSQSSPILPPVNWGSGDTCDAREVIRADTFLRFSAGAAC